jgi:ubiquinone/menaquinone biosynthesis C-methylase UbiE
VRRVGLYERHVLPRLIDRALDTGECRKYRARVTRGLSGRVLEVGFGSGLNLPFYPAEVESIAAIDPSGTARKLAAERVAACHAPVEYAGLDGERLPFADDTFDCAITTFTLCTIPDVVVALRELRRVLKPGSALHFLEHGRCPSPGVARWQDRLNPLQRVIGGGCNINRKIDELLAEGGFAIEELDTFHMKGPRVFSHMFAGRALA